MNRLSWSFRAFTPSDQAAARRLILEGLGEHFGAVDETRNPDIDDIAVNYIGRGHLFLVAEDMLGLVGTAALVFDDGAGAADRTRFRGAALAEERSGEGVGDASDGGRPYVRAGTAVDGDQ